MDITFQNYPIFNIHINIHINQTYYPLKTSEPGHLHGFPNVKTQR